MNSPSLEFHWLGRIVYADALALQDSTVAARIRNEVPDQIFLLEHDPVFTIGRTRDRSSLGEVSSLPHPVVEVSRGGQATYHGPGQLVGYPILDLKSHGQDLHRYLRSLEDAIIRYARSLGVAAERREGLTGVWVGPRKLASIGVGVRHWITLHGFALNIHGPLAGFDAITPCGLANVEITSLESEGCPGLSVVQAAEDIQPHLLAALGELKPT